MGNLIDLAKTVDYARSAHAISAALVSGVNQDGNPVLCYTGDNTGNVPLVEPRHLSKASPALQPNIDELTRVIVITNFIGTMDASALHVQMQFGRDTGLYEDIGGLLRVSNAAQEVNLHILENPFPADFCRVANGGTDIDDTLRARMRVVPTATSTGSVIVMATALLIPGPLTGHRTPPRGTIYSTAGIDY